MLKYTIRRMIQSVITIFLIATIVFLLMRLLPTDYYFTEDELKDPTKTPDGTPVEGTPEPQDHNNVTPPPEQPSTNTSGGLPGFDNVPNAGANQGGSIDSDGDINTQVGIMG